MADSTPQIDLLDGVAGMRGDSSAGSASVPVGGSGNATTTSAGNGEPGIAAVASPMVEVKAGPLVGGNASTVQPTRKRDRSPTQPAPNKLIRTDAGAAHASQPTQTLIQIPPANANPAAPQTLRPQTGTPSTLPPTTSSLIPPTSAPQPATVPTIPPTTVTSHSSQPQTQQPSAPSKPEQAQSQNQGQSSSSQSQPSQQVPPPHRKRLDGEPPLIIDDPALTSLPEGVKERFLGSLRYHSPRYPRPALPTTSSVSLHPLPPFTGVDLYGVLEVRVPALECSVENLGVKKRAVWGTGVYTDDSDVVAALIHSGWIRPSDAPPIVSPPANFSTAGYQLPTDPPPPPSSFPQPPPLPIPVDSVPGRTVVARLRVLPKLTRYAGTLRNGLRSRSWGGGHGGESFRVEGVELLDEPTRGGRKSEVKTFGDSEGIVVVVGEGLVSYKYQPSLLVSWPPHVYRAMWQQLDDEPPTTFNSGLAPNSLLFPALPSDAPPDRARIDDARMRAWQAGWDELSKLYKGVRLPALWNEGWEGWRVRMEVEVLYMDVIEGQNRSRYELSLQIPALASPTRAARPPTPPSTLPSVSGPPGVGDRYRLALLDPNAFASWDEPLPACPVPGNYEGVRGRKVVLGVLARDLEASDLRFVEIGLVVRGGAAGKVWNGHGRGNSNGNIGAKGGDDERGSKGLSGTGQTNGGPEDGNGGVGKPHLHPSGEGTLAHARPSSSGGGVNAPVGASRRKIGVNNVMGGMLGSEGGFALRISRFFWRRKVV